MKNSYHPLYESAQMEPLILQTLMGGEWQSKLYVHVHKHQRHLRVCYVYKYPWVQQQTSQKV